MSGKKWFVVSLKGKSEPNSSISGTSAEEEDGKLLIRDGNHVVASFDLKEVQGWQSFPDSGE